MKKKTSKRIEPGELTRVGEGVYMASTWDETRPCTEQCSLAKGEACNGYCYRWENTEQVVFRHILPAALLGDEVELVETPDVMTGAILRLQIESSTRAKLKYYNDVVKKQRESDKKS